MEESEDPLEPGPGVDVALGQVVEDAVVVPVVLHEDEVPELDVALLATAGRAALLTEVGAPVVVQLGAGTARPGRPHGPEVVGFAPPLDPLPGDPDLVGPDLDRLVVGLEHRHPDPLRVELEDRGGQLPGEGDRLLLEVVAEREVAQHLEEREVAGGRADDVDVGGAEALLDGRGPGPRRLLLAEHVGLELHHARRGEQQRGVVGHEARRRQRRVTVGLEEPEEGAS